MEFHKAKIVQCEPHEGYKLWIRFDDGLAGEVDLSALVGKGVFTAWESLAFFRSVYIEKKLIPLLGVEI